MPILHHSSWIVFQNLFSAFGNEKYPMNEQWRFVVTFNEVLIYLSYCNRKINSFTAQLIGMIVQNGCRVYRKTPKWVRDTSKILLYGKSKKDRKKLKLFHSIYQQNILKLVFEEEILALKEKDIDKVELHIIKASSYKYKSSAISIYLAKKVSETAITYISNLA